MGRRALDGARHPRIEGRVIGDDDARRRAAAALAWAWDDLGYTTGALFGALNFAENRMRSRFAGRRGPARRRC